MATTSRVQANSGRSSAISALQLQLISDAQVCQLCVRMSHSRRVLSHRNGDWGAEVLFIAEAPGRLGAEVTGVPLFGDRTGDRFEALLRAMGWSRSRVFVTNAVLCNPRNHEGNNDPPKPEEIRNCSTFLKRTISTINPRLVVALGRIALIALNSIHPHDLELRQAAGQVFKWGNRYLAALYHPGPRTQVHRKWSRQLADANAVAEFARRRLRINPQRTKEDLLFEEGPITDNR